MTSGQLEKHYQRRATVGVITRPARVSQFGQPLITIHLGLDFTGRPGRRRNVFKCYTKNQNEKILAILAKAGANDEQAADAIRRAQGIAVTHELTKSIDSRPTALYVEAQALKTTIDEVLRRLDNLRPDLEMFWGRKKPKRRKAANQTRHSLELLSRYLGFGLRVPLTPKRKESDLKLALGIYALRGIWQEVTGRWPSATASRDDMRGTTKPTAFGEFVEAAFRRPLNLEITLRSLGARDPEKILAKMGMPPAQVHDMLRPYRP